MRDITKFYIIIGAFLVLSILLIVPTLGYNLSEPLDASAINGIITAIAILPGFISSEAAKLKSGSAKFVFILMLVLLLTVTSENYFLSEMRFGHPTKFVLLVAMINLLFNVFSASLIMWARERL